MYAYSVASRGPQTRLRCLGLHIKLIYIQLNMNKKKPHRHAAYCYESYDSITPKENKVCKRLTLRVCGASGSYPDTLAFAGISPESTREKVLGPPIPSAISLFFPLPLSWFVFVRRCRRRTPTASWAIAPYRLMNVWITEFEANACEMIRLTVRPAGIPKYGISAAQTNERRIYFE